MTFTSFELRKRFMAIWRDSTFDLYYFHNNTAHIRMAKHIAWLTAKLDHTNLAQPGNFIEAVQQGYIHDDYFSKHGPALALQWVMGYEKAQGIPAKKGKQPPSPPVNITLESLAKVDWNSDILRALLEPINPSVPQPKGFHHKTKRPEFDKGSFWISTEQIFDVILKLDETKGEECSGAGMDALAQMMDETLKLE